MKNQGNFKSLPTHKSGSETPIDTPSFCDVDRILRLAENANAAFQRSDRALGTLLWIGETVLFLALAAGLYAIYLHADSIGVGADKRDWFAALVLALLALLPTMVFVQVCKKKRQAQKADVFRLTEQVVKSLAIVGGLPHEANWSELQQYEYNLRVELLKSTHRNPA